MKLSIWLNCKSGLTVDSLLPIQKISLSCVHYSILQLSGHSAVGRDRGRVLHRRRRRRIRRRARRRQVRPQGQLEVEGFQEFTHFYLRRSPALQVNAGWFLFFDHKSSP